MSKASGKQNALKLELDLEKAKENGSRAVQDLTFPVWMSVKCILRNMLKLQCDECLSGCDCLQN